MGLFGAGAGFMGIFLGMESLPSGTHCYLAKSGRATKKVFRRSRDLYAIGSGGLFGTGLGGSIQKLGFVPEAQNDMIFSVICEELGLVGAWLVMILFALLLWRLMVIATHAADLLGALTCSRDSGTHRDSGGAEIAVVTNTIPNTGITLPFISYGGTSVLFLLAELGLALSVSRYSEKI